MCLHMKVDTKVPERLPLAQISSRFFLLYIYFVSSFLHKRINSPWDDGIMKNKKKVYRQGGNVKCMNEYVINRGAFTLSLQNRIKRSLTACIRSIACMLRRTGKEKTLECKWEMKKKEKRNTKLRDKVSKW